MMMGNGRGPKVCFPRKIPGSDPQTPTSSTSKRPSSSPVSGRSKVCISIFSGATRTIARHFFFMGIPLLVSENESGVSGGAPPHDKVAEGLYETFLTVGI